MKVKRIKKKKSKELKAPSIIKRCLPTYIYNLIWTGIFFFLWFRFYSLDELAFELDYLTMYSFSNGFSSFRWQIIPCVILFLLTFRQFFKDINVIRFTFASMKYDKETTSLGCKIAYEGVEGVGKTLNLCNTLILTAAKKDRQMRLAYYSQYPYRKELENDVDFNVLENSFNFYERNEDKIPHVMTDFELYYDGRKAYDFDMRYIDQEKRLPEGMVMGLTELANRFPNAWSRLPADESKDVHKIRIKSETFSLSRQYFDLTMITDEQRTGEVFLPFRSCISSNRSLTACEKLLEANFIRYFLEMTDDLILMFKKKTPKFLSAFNSFLEKLYRDIGFNRYYYIDKNSVKDTVKDEGLCFITPSKFLFEFDSRCKRKEYKLYDSKIDS